MTVLLLNVKPESLLKFFPNHNLPLSMYWLPTGSCGSCLWVSFHLFLLSILLNSTHFWPYLVCCFVYSMLYVFCIPGGNKVFLIWFFYYNLKALFIRFTLIFQYVKPYLSYLLHNYIISHSLWKGSLIQLQKVSTLVSQRGLRRLTWADTFSLSFNFLHFKDQFNIMIRQMFGQIWFYRSIITQCNRWVQHYSKCIYIVSALRMVLPSPVNGSLGIMGRLFAITRPECMYSWKKKPKSDLFQFFFYKYSMNGIMGRWPNI